MAFQTPPPSPYWAPNSGLVAPDYSTLDELGLNPTTGDPLASPSVAQNVITPDAKQNSTPAKEIIRKTSERDPGAGQGLGTPAPRDMTNDFGYIDKPGWMDYAGLAGVVSPVLGLGAKAVNLGINTNNQVATSEARKVLGLPEQDTFDKAKGVLKDQHGIVSNNVKINEKNYSIGFEAQTKDNRTTLTPNEARTRSLTLGGMEEVAAPKQETNKVQSIFDSIFDEAKTTLSSIFDDKPSVSHQIAMQPGRAAPAPAAVQNGATPSNSPGPWGAQGNGLARGMDSRTMQIEAGPWGGAGNFSSPSRPDGREGGLGLGGSSSGMHPNTPDREKE